VATEDVRPAARDADVAERELQDARRAHYRVADGVLRLSHAPDDGARAVLGKSFCDLQQLLGRHAGDVLHFLRRPLLQDFFPDLLHAVDTVMDVFLVFPAVLENDVQHPEQEGISVPERMRTYVLRRRERGSTTNAHRFRSRAACAASETGADVAVEPRSEPMSTCASARHRYPLLVRDAAHHFQERLEDKKYIHDRVYGMKEVREEVLKKWTPEEVQNVTGVTPEQLLRSQKLFAKNRPSTIVCAWDRRSTPSATR